MPVVLTLIIYVSVGCVSFFSGRRRPRLWFCGLGMGDLQVYQTLPKRLPLNVLYQVSSINDAQSGTGWSLAERPGGAGPREHVAIFSV